MKKILRELPLLLLLLGCGVNSSQQRRVPNSIDLELPYPLEFISDVTDSKVQACEKFQSFALDRCWDEIEIKDTGALILSRAADRLVLVEDGNLSIDAAALYTRIPDIKGKALRRHTKIDHLMRSTGYDYWLLPAEIEVDEAVSPIFGVRITRAPFKLVDWALYHGKANICGVELRLPLIIKDVEAACGVKANNFQEIVIKRSDVTLRIVFDHLATDMAQGWESRLRSGAVVFER